MIERLDSREADGVSGGSEVPRISFRILGSPEMAEALKTRKPELRAKPSRKGTGQAISFALCFGDLDWLPDFINEYAPPPGSYDIFISLVTEKDTWIIDVPDYAIELIRRIGGGLCFSATIV